MNLVFSMLRGVVSLIFTIAVGFIGLLFMIMRLTLPPLITALSNVQRSPQGIKASGSKAEFPSSDPPIKMKTDAPKIPDYRPYRR